MHKKLQVLMKEDFRISKGLFQPTFPSNSKRSFLQLKSKNALLALFCLLTSWLSFAQLNQETFEQGIPSTWTTTSVGGSALWSSTTDGYLGSNAVTINPANDILGEGQSAEYFLVTSRFEVPANAQLSFQSKRSTNDANDGVIYQVRYSTSPTIDLDEFVTLTEWSGSNLNSGADNVYERPTITLPSSIVPGTQIYLAFVAVTFENGADAWFIDNVQVSQTCTAPTDFEITETTAYTARMFWQHADSNFEIQLVPQDEELSSNGTRLYTAMYYATDLIPNTTYNVYIKALCNDSEHSSWTLMETFTTHILGRTCAEPIVIDSNNYSFSAEMSVYNNFGDTSFTTVGGSCIVSNDNYLAGNKIYMTYTATESGIINIDQTAWNRASSQALGFNNCWGNAKSSVFIYDSCSEVGSECLAATYTSTANVPGYLSNFYVEQGRTYTIVLSNSFNSNATVCFTFNLNFVTCSAPAVFTTTNLTTTTANVSWDNPGQLSDSWEYYVTSDLSMTQPTDVGVPVQSNINVLLNVDNFGQSLAPGTKYHVFVRSKCGGDYSIWSRPYLITTLCEPFSLPYYNSLIQTGNPIPDCWSAVDINGDGVTFAGSSTGPSIFVANTRSINNDMLISPAIIIPNNDSVKKVKFNYAIVSSQVGYRVLMSTTGTAPEDFVHEIKELEYFNATVWNVPAEEEIILPSGISGTVYFAIHVPSDARETGNRLTVSNFYVLEDCDAPVADSLTATEIVSDSALLSWTAGNAEHNAWEVLVLPAGSAAPQMQDSGVLVDSNEYRATGLEGAKRYVYYVKTSCSATATSVWVGPYAFITSCSEPMTVPYVENFDAVDADTKFFCWTVHNGNGDNRLFTIMPNAATATHYQLAGATNVTPDDWLITPAITLSEENSGHHLIQFTHNGTGGGWGTNILRPYGIELLVSYTDNSPESFTTLAEREDFLGANGTATQYSRYFYGEGVAYFAIRIKDVAGINAASIIIDNFKITSVPTCIAPLNITKGATTDTTVEVSWTAGYEETLWEVVAVPFGTIPTQGAAQTDETSYVFTDLAPGLAYDFYVRAVCNTNDTSDWVGPIRHTTPCDRVFTVPFFEGFETDTINCWSATSWVLTNSLNPYEGNRAATVYTWENGNRWMISPAITLEENQHVLKFYYRASQFSPTYVEDLKVWMSTEGNSIEQMQAGTLLYSNTVSISNTEYKEMVIMMPEGITGNVHIGFQIPNMEGPSYFRQTVFIDNISVTVAPDCALPYEIQAQTIADTSFELNFVTPGNESSWEVLVVPHGTANPFETMTDDQLHLISTSTGYTISGLTPATAYDVYIRTVCGDNNSEVITSEWSSSLQVTTLCDIASMCLYTIELSGEEWSGSSGNINVIQNGVVMMSLTIPSNAQPQTTGQVPLYLCAGTEFSLFWESSGWAQGMSSRSRITIYNNDGSVFWQSPYGFGNPRTTIYTNVASCAEVTCAAPIDLTVTENGDLTWTSAGSETQWEVFIQPTGLGALPQSGTVVTTTSYTPQSADFLHSNVFGYEYFVRAICVEGDASYWSGPFLFLTNDEISGAAVAQVSENENCAQAVEGLGFNHSTVSTLANVCGVENNYGDIWVQFTATSATHQILVDNFSGELHTSTVNDMPNVVMSLYKMEGNEYVLITCSDNNVIRTLYGNELTPGETYWVRLTNASSVYTPKTFDVCVTTLTELCRLDAPNFSFENPTTGGAHTMQMGIRDAAYVGWRTNIPGVESIFTWNSENDVSAAFEGGQFIQLSFQGPEQNQNDLVNVYGLYQDFDSSELTQFDYSFAFKKRGSSGTAVIQLFAGPVEGPFVLISEHVSNASWTNKVGKYNVPEGQDKTRFIFRTKNNDGTILLDAANFIPNNEVLTIPHTIYCENPTVDLRAEGVGQWSAAESNPAGVLFSDIASKNTTVSGFTAPGAYTFYWTTRYCQSSVVITFEGINEVPTVTSPVEYCQGMEAEALTASSLEGFTLQWFTEAVGGVAHTTIVPSTETVGTYTYYVSYADEFGCAGARTPIEVVVSALDIPVVDFSYDAAQYCTNNESIAVILSENFTEGGLFTATEGLMIDPITGAVDFSLSTAGNHTITYTLEATPCREGASATFDMVVIDFIETVAEFVYDKTSYCSNGANPVIALSEGFTVGGTFTSADGLVIDASTGAIDLATSTAGTYEITYTVDAGTCSSSSTHTVSITITEYVIPVVEFTYNSSVYCISGDSPIIALSEGFTLGGVFTSTNGLSIDAATGVVNLATSQAGIYDVTYTVAEGDCSPEMTSTVTIEIYDLEIPVVEFNYDANSYCISSNNPILSIVDTFEATGIFTVSPSGLSINAETGSIDLVNSVPGTYVITYTVEIDNTLCIASNSSSVTLEVVGQMPISISESCDGTSLVLTANSELGTAASYVWFDDQGNAIGNGVTFDVNDYIQNNTHVNFPLNVVVQIEGDSVCYEAGTYSLSINNCSQIPRGISPNGDGNNDNFDLRGMGVTSVQIMNRYGVEVYNFNGNYTNQWYGQASNGNELPTGTYFYVVTLSNGSSQTGWVYINR